MRILLFLSDLMIPLLFFYIIGFGLLMKRTSTTTSSPVLSTV